MRLADRVLEAVAGRGLADRRDLQKLEKQYADLPQMLKNVTDITYEPRLISEDVTNPSKYARTGSIAIGPPKEGSIRSSRPLVQRAQSEIKGKKEHRYQSPSGAPDITAMELTDDQLKRTYSASNVWDTRCDRLPPLPQMEGIGRFRVAKDADIDWKVQNFQRCIQGFEPLHEKFGDLALYDSSPEVRERCKQSLRSYSFASTQSSRSESSTGLTEEKINTKTGTRVFRGFAPSLPSSASGSFKESIGFPRRDSSQSTTSNSGEPEYNLAKIASRQPTLRNHFLNGMDQLTTINETTGFVSKRAHKKSIPCLFEMEGDPDSALASVASDEIDELSSVWVDTFNDNDSEAIKQHFEQADQAHGAAEPIVHASREIRARRPKTRFERKKVVDKSKPFKTAPKAIIRSKLASRHDVANDQVLQKGDSNSLVEVIEEESEGELASPSMAYMATFPGSSTEADVDLVVFPDDANQEELKTTTLDRDIDDNNDDNTCSANPDSTAKISVALTVGVCTESPVWRRRERSATAIRMPPIQSCLHR